MRASRHRVSWRVLLITGAVIGAATLMPRPARALPTAVLLERADEALDARRWKAAEEALRTALRQGNLSVAQTAAAYAHLGVALTMQQRLELARAAFLRAALINPRFVLRNKIPGRGIQMFEAARVDAGGARLQIATELPASTKPDQPLSVDVDLTLPREGIAKSVRLSANHAASGKHFQKSEPVGPKVHFEVPTEVMVENLFVIRIELLDVYGNRLAELTRTVDVDDGTGGAETPPDPSAGGGATPDPTPAPVASDPAEADKGAKVLELHGTVRTIAAGVHSVNGPTPANLDGLSLSQARLTAKINAGPVTIDAHVLQLLAFSTVRTSVNDLGPYGPLRYRALALSNTWASSDRSAATFFVDRLSAKFALPWFDVTVGRQPINFSKAYFWSPLDVFVPFSPRTIDREYKPGVDAVKIDIPIGEASGVNLVGAAGPSLIYDPLQGQLTPTRRVFSAAGATSALIGRAFTNVGGYDISVQGGSVYGGYHGGLGVAGEVGGYGVRAEATYFVARNVPPLLLPAPTGADPDRLIVLQPYVNHARFVAGIERRFENSLYLSAEYFFNGAAPGSRDYLTPSFQQIFGETTNLSRHLIGAVASYDISPTVVGRLSGIVGLASTASALLTPTLDWSVAENADLQFGALLTAGARPAVGPINIPTPMSEFGTYPNVYFVQFKVFF